MYVIICNLKGKKKVFKDEDLYELKRLGLELKLMGGKITSFYKEFSDGSRIEVEKPWILSKSAYNYGLPKTNKTWRKVK